jgi:hypothetical protein
MEDIMCGCSQLLARSKEVYFRSAADTIGYHLLAHEDSNNAILDRVTVREHEVEAKRAVFPFQIICLSCGTDVACMRSDAGTLTIFFDAAATHIRRHEKPGRRWRNVHGECFYIKTMEGQDSVSKAEQCAPENTSVAEDPTPSKTKAGENTGRFPPTPDRTGQGHHSTEKGRKYISPELMSPTKQPHSEAQQAPMLPQTINVALEITSVGFGLVMGIILSMFCMLLSFWTTH